MFRRSLFVIAILVAGLAWPQCQWPGKTDQPFPFFKKETSKEPQKIALPGMVPEGADLSAAIADCAGPVQLEELRPSPFGGAANRSSAAATVSGSFQGLADFIACFAQGEVKWELGDLKIWRGPPKFGDYRMEVNLIAYQFVMVPGPELPDRAAAEKWFQGLPARVRKEVGLLSDLYVATEPSIELREIALSKGQGSLSGRALSYEDISALIEELKGKGLVQNSRVETIRLSKSRMVEKKQEFELRFAW